MALDKRYVYKVSRNGVYLGVLPNVKSQFGYTQNINTPAAQLEILVGTTPDTSHQSVDAIETEAGAPLQTEASETIYIERQPDVVGDGNSLALIRNDNDITVYEFSANNPNGKLVFSGYVSKWKAQFGGSNEVSMTVLSYGTELDNYIIQGAPTVDQSQALTDNTTTAVEPGGMNAGWLRIGQTFTVGAGVTSLSSILLKIANNYSAFPQTATVRVWNSITEAGAEFGTPLAIASVALTTTTQTDTLFTFATPLAVNAGQQYFFSIHGSDQYGIAISRYNSNVYAGGALQYNIYGGGGGGSLWLPGYAGLGLELYFKTYYTAGATSVPFSSSDPSTMLTTIIDTLIAQGGVVNYSGSSVTATGLSRSYTFKVNTILEGVRKCLDLAPANYYWYVDPATSTIYFKPTSATAEHYIILGRHINVLDIEATKENIKNIVYFSGGDVGGGVNLFQKLTDSQSLIDNRVGLSKLSDNRVTLSDTATAFMQNELDTHDEQEYNTTVTVLETTYDITTYNVGQVVGFEGFGNFADSLLLQIVAIARTPDSAVLTLGVLPRRASAKVEQLSRALDDLNTIDNPSTPS